MNEQRRLLNEVLHLQESQSEEDTRAASRLYGDIDPQFLHASVKQLLSQGRFAQVYRLNAKHPAINEYLAQLGAQELINATQDKAFMKLLVAYDRGELLFKEFCDKDNQALADALWQGCRLLSDRRDECAVEFLRIMKFFPQNDFINESLVQLVPEQVFFNEEASFYVSWKKPLLSRPYTPEEVVQAYANMQDMGLSFFSGFKKHHSHRSFFKDNFFYYSREYFSPVHANDLFHQDNLKKYLAFANTVKNQDAVLYSLMCLSDIYDTPLIVAQKDGPAKTEQQRQHELLMFNLANFDLSTVLKGAQQCLEYCQDKPLREIDASLVHHLLSDIVHRYQDISPPAEQISHPLLQSSSQALMDFFMQQAPVFVVIHNELGFGQIKEVGEYVALNIQRYCTPSVVEKLLFPPSFTVPEKFNPAQHSDFIYSLLQHLVSHAIKTDNTEVLEVFSLVNDQKCPTTGLNLQIYRFIQKNPVRFQAMFTQAQCEKLDSLLPQGNTVSPRRVKI